MPNIGLGNISKVRLAEQGSNPAAPAATFSILYVLASGVLRVRNAAATVYEFVTTAHDHSGTTNGPKLTQANSHESADTDAAAESLHHTLGAGGTQAAAGDHSHAAPDASVVTYTPAVLTDWDGDADPGDADNALDQLAERVDDLEGVAAGTVVTTIVLGDASAALGAGTDCNPIPMEAPTTLTITEVRLKTKTAPTNQAIIVDVHKNGTPIFTNQANRPQIAAAATEGNTTTIDVSALVKGDDITFDLDQVGTGTTGGPLMVEIICTQTVG